MKPLRLSGAFKRDVKRLARRGNRLAKLESLVTQMRKDIPLAPIYQPHPLKGEWVGYWDCHIENDWILIYKITKNEVLLARTGSHSDLFE